VDLTSFGCASGLIDDVYDVKNECVYCYGGYMRKKKCLMKTEIQESDWNRYRHISNIVRIGKFSEPGHVVLRNSLLNVLKLNKKYNFRSILITKLLEFDKQIACLLTSTRSSLAYSLGREDLEPGLYKQGSTNEWRIAQALKYQRNGVRVLVRPVIDITGLEPFDFIIPPSLDVLITPIRFFSKDSVKKFFTKRITWDILLNKGIYRLKGGMLVPNKISQDLVWYNICGTVGTQHFCYKCGLIQARKLYAKEKTILLV